MIDRGGAKLDGDLHPWALRELIAVHAQAEAGVAAGAQDLARLVGVEAPRSQNTSIQRTCGAQARSISPHTRSTYSSGRSAYSGGTR